MLLHSFITITFIVDSHTQTISSLFKIEPEVLLRQESVVINQNEQGGNSNNAYIINQLSEKLLAQYEARIKELQEQLKKALGY